MTRSLIRFVTWMAVGAIALTGCATAPAPTPEPPPSPTPAAAQATIGLTYIPDIQFAPFYVADAEGMFAQRGLDATLRHHGASEGLFTALAAGQEDYVIAGGDELLQARAEGMDLVAIAQYYRSYPVAIIVPETSDIASVADLRGRRVGVPGRYGETWFGLQAALAGAQLAESDLEVVEVGYTQQVALTTGRVDAIVGFVNNDQVQFGLAGIPTRTIPLTADGQVPLVSIVLATTGDNLRAHPEVARQVAGSMVAGIERTVEAPASAVSAARSHIPTLDEAGREASALATLEATIPLWTTPEGTVSGTMDPSAWRSMTDFMHQRGLLKAPVDPTEAMTNDVITP